MHPTQLFVYGTLRHDQPEHAKYCRGVTGWRPARLRAQLWMVPAGYRLAVVPPAAVLLSATSEAAVDEQRRSAIAHDAFATANQALESSGFFWLEGEILSFRDAGEAWPPLDRWEEFTPGGGGCYARVVVPVEVVDTRQSSPTPAWAYVATGAPVGSLPWSG